MTGEPIDLVTLGRANLDLYSQSIGAAFEDSTAFDAMVGGSPTNIAIGAARLGLTATVLTGVGDDRCGDFILANLRRENVDTDHIRTVPGKLTSLALLGVQPPDIFPLTFYRDDPADIYLTISDVDALDIEAVRTVEVSGNALSRGPCVGAARRLLEIAGTHGIVRYMDMDLRPSEWPDAGTFGRAISSAAVDVDVLIGTEEEFFAAFMRDADDIMRGNSVPEARREELSQAIAAILEVGPSVVVTKRGPLGATVSMLDNIIDVPGFPVEVVNTVGAGDSFAAGLIRSRLLGLDWYESTRYANACGAIVVTRHGCSLAFPTSDEVVAFMTEHE